MSVPFKMNVHDKLNPYERNELNSILPYVYKIQFDVRYIFGYKRHGLVEFDHLCDTKHGNSVIMINKYYFGACKKYSLLVEEAVAACGVTVTSKKSSLRSLTLGPEGKVPASQKLGMNFKEIHCDDARRLQLVKVPQVYSKTFTFNIMTKKKPCNRLVNLLVIRYLNGFFQDSTADVYIEEVDSYRLECIKIDYLKTKLGL